MSGANLRVARLSGARTVAAILSGADMSGADVQGVDLKSTIGLETAIVEDICRSSTTVWPAWY